MHWKLIMIREYLFVLIALKYRVFSLNLIKNIFLALILVPMSKV